MHLYATFYGGPRDGEQITLIRPPQKVLTLLVPGSLANSMLKGEQPARPTYDLYEGSPSPVSKMWRYEYMGQVHSLSEADHE